MHHQDSLPDLLSSSHLFEPEWYRRTYSDVDITGLDPFTHFVRVGHGLRRSPGPLFDPKWYLIANPDVEAAKMDPLVHYAAHGRQEGRLGYKPKLDIKRTTTSLSIVIPTYNRATALPQTVEALHANAEGLDVEVIIVNDGSSDKTKDVLQELSHHYEFLRVINAPNQGAGIARNYGAAAAEKDIILFLGDDILPGNRYFLAAHAFYHQEIDKTPIAVLGKVEWPSDSSFEVTAVMKHIQGSGGEQFGYTDMLSHRYWDWRFFYTCNVSVRRDVVNDWTKHGFHRSFRGCGFEDAEFAYRMRKTHGSFDIFYTDESLGLHYHRHTVRSFIRRQRLCGAMARVLLETHPELAEQLGMSTIQQALHVTTQTPPLSQIEDNLQLSESLFRWAESLEIAGCLGRAAWHKGLLHSIFNLSTHLGYVESAATPLSNYTNAIAHCLEISCAILEQSLPKDQWEAEGFVA